jgi:hypothetical protein
MPLKPQNLIQAAEADLRRRRDNRAGYKSYGYGAKMSQFAFFGPHVRKARSARQLLILALMHPPVKFDEELGVVVLDTTKQNMKLIYGNGALLVQAIRICHKPKIRVPMWRENEVTHERTEDSEAPASKGV